VAAYRFAFQPRQIMICTSRRRLPTYGNSELDASDSVAWVAQPFRVREKNHTFGGLTPQERLLSQALQACLRYSRI
jgi:hypothetical protein